MRPSISANVNTFRCMKSPVREIMDFANPDYFRKVGLDPADVISFSGGWVNHEAPQGLRAAYAAIIADTNRFHASGGYSATIGSPQCRSAIAAYERHLFGDAMKLAAENIAIGASSTQLTFNLMSILLNPGDKLMLLDPSYCNFPSQVTNVGSVQIVRLPVLDVESWRYVADERVKEAREFILQQKPKMILLVAPDNPTSQVPGQAFVEAALEAAREVGAMLVIDFAYKEIVWGEKPAYFAWGPQENFCSLHSNSKWCRGLGRRLGWIEGPQYLIEAIEAIQGSSILCPDSLHQMALADYIEAAIAQNGLRPYVEEMCKLYERAAKRTTAAIREYTGLPCLDPQGGLYTVVRTGCESSQFAKDLLEKTGVLAVPGWGFGDTLRHAVRLSYGPLVHEPEKIDAAMKKLAEFMRL